MRSGQKEKKRDSFDSVDEDNNFYLNKAGEIYQKPLFIICSAREYENIFQRNKQVSYSAQYSLISHLMMVKKKWFNY